jgi:hypothetical protein
MSRDITDLSVGHLLNYHPPNFVDSTDAQIEMGKDVPFSDEPIKEVDTIANRYPSGERFGFTSRYYPHACEDSPQVKQIKAIIRMRQQKRSRS